MTMKEKLINFYERTKHGIPAIIYTAIYMLWFTYLEKTITRPDTIIHTVFDDKIPFIPVFVIPYFLWFGYVVINVIIIGILDKDEFNKMFILLATGMTVFLVISTIWPNGHDLRPNIAYINATGGNVFTRMIANLYSTDTPTNLWPSIHVYNSLGIHFALTHCPKTRKHTAVRVGSLILCTSIILSTMFIKQHSVFDVATGILLAIIMYCLIYPMNMLGAIKAAHERRKLEKNLD